MRRIGPQLALAAAVLALVLAPSSALAASYPNTPNGAITDCSRTGKLTQHFSVAVLLKALAEMKTVSLQYGDCETVIRNTELAEISPTRNSGGANAVANATSGASGLTGALAQQVNQAIRGGARPLTFNGETIAAGMSALHDSSLLGALPTPLLVAFLALLATGVALAARALRDVVRTRRSA